MAMKLEFDARTVGELIRMIREERDLTQTDVARVLGASQSKVAKWEAGAHEMKFVDAVAFSEEMHVPLEWLVTALKREKAPANAEALRSKVGDTRLRNLVFSVVRPKGFEPLTFWSVVCEGLGLAEQIDGAYPQQIEPNIVYALSGTS